MTTRTRVSLEEFLAMPETEPASELIDGEVIQKVAPSIFHGRIVAELNRLLGNYLLESGEGMVVTEVRHVNEAEARAFLPDINVALRTSIPNIRRAQSGRGVAVPPDFAIEVLSPGDWPGRVLEKVSFYMRSGTRLLWVIDPDTESITAHRPGASPTEHSKGQLSGAPVLQGFTLDIEKLFAVLHEDYEFDDD